jgi:predicted nucleic acid-binding protein
MNLLLDTGILGQLCHPNKDQNRPVTEWLTALLNREDILVRVFVPEIADYELRRKLLHLIHQSQATSKSIERLDALAQLLEYLPLNTQTMRSAAALWADARRQGVPTTTDVALDGDVLACGASVGGAGNGCHHQSQASITLCSHE